MRHWVLPEYVEDVLPEEARHVEALRRELLDVFAGHGYSLVMPPMIEHLESLLTGTGHDLDLRTFKLVDQLSGRMLGLRADITPQVARIDAHLLNRPGVTRLAYCGTVLHALPAGMSQSREVLQIGAELYGHSGVESDIEIQRLMLAALRQAGVVGMHLDLGHVGLFRSLCRHGGVEPELESEFFQALQGKDVPGLRTLTKGLAEPTRRSILALPELFGGTEVLETARKVLPDYPEVRESLDQVDAICRHLASHVDALMIDLAELRGYHYHSGVVFAAYASGMPNVLAQGGRYDDVGKAFGRARAATGFSLDLRALAAMTEAVPVRGIIAAPWGDDAALAEAVRALRAEGEIVVMRLPGECDDDEMHNARRELVQRDGRWVVVAQH